MVTELIGHPVIIEIATASSAASGGAGAIVAYALSFAGPGMNLT